MFKISTIPVNRPPSLVDLCVKVAINNLRYLGDVGETDSHLLERILPHCTVDQLMHVEKCSKGRDLSPVTDKLWKKLYEGQFSTKSMNLVIERMKQMKVSFRWKQLYEAKLNDMQEAVNKAADRLRQRYRNEDARKPSSSESTNGKQSRQVQLCSKVPPSSNKRGFKGPGYDFSNVKSNIMKKAKIDLMKSQEVKNLAALRRNAIQRSHSSPTMAKSNGTAGKKLASTSKLSNPPARRF